MVLVETPHVTEAGKEWSTVQGTDLFKVLKYTPNKSNPIQSLLKPNAVAPAPFKLVTAHAPNKTIATGETLDAILADGDLLASYLAGCPPENCAAVTPAVRAALEEEVKAATKDNVAKVKADGNADAVVSVSGNWKDAAKNLEPWAVKLLENADQLRYVCYALKIATSFSADIASGGMGGEEVVQLCFVGVNSLVLSSWLTWFVNSYLDESPGASVVREALKLDFSGGPRVVLDKANEMCKNLRKEDLEQLTRFAMLLKKRIAVLVGDVTSLCIPEDFGVVGVMISELLVQMQASSAVDAVTKMVEWYEMIPADLRHKLENVEELGNLLALGNTTVRKAVMSEYDKPLGTKVVWAGVRHVLTIPFLPLHFANMAGSASLCANVGKSACVATFSAVDDNLPEVAMTLQKTLAMGFGVLVLLANCADAADNGNRKCQIDALGAKAGGRALEVLPTVLAAAKGNGKGQGGLAAGLAAGVTEMAKKMVKK